MLSFSQVTGLKMFLVCGGTWLRRALKVRWFTSARTTKNPAFVSGLSWIEPHMRWDRSQLDNLSPVHLELFSRCCELFSRCCVFDVVNTNVCILCHQYHLKAEVCSFYSVTKWNCKNMISIYSKVPLWWKSIVYMSMWCF